MYSIIYPRRFSRGMPNRQNLDKVLAFVSPVKNSISSTQDFADASRSTARIRRPNQRKISQEFDVLENIIADPAGRRRVVVGDIGTKLAQLIERAGRSRLF